MIQQIAKGRRAKLIGDQAPHVLLVVDGFPKTLGGGERIVLRLAELLPQYGYRTSILTFALHAEGEFDVQEAPCPVYLLPLTNTYNLQALRAAFALRRFLRQQNIRIVQTFFESSDIWAGFVTKLLSDAKLIWSRRDMGILRSRKHQIAYRTLRSLPDAVTAVSARVAEHVRNVDGVPAPKVHIIYNGLDVAPLVAETATSMDVVDRKLLITTVGNIRRVKGHDLFVQAAAEVSKWHPDAQFLVAGDILEAEYFDTLAQQVEVLGLSETFRFVGRISDLQDYLKDASIFVLPSRSEGFSNALVEAMAAGVPAVATDVGGNAEAIQDGQNGLLIPPEDADALAQAIGRLLDDPHLALRLGRAGRRTVQDRFSADAMMQRITDLYRTLLRPA